MNDTIVNPNDIMSDFWWCFRASYNFVQRWEHTETSFQIETRRALREFSGDDAARVLWRDADGGPWVETFFASIARNFRPVQQVP